MGKGKSMNETEFINKIYEAANRSNPDIDYTSTFQDVLKELDNCVDKSLRWDILALSFQPEPELFPVNNSRRMGLRETQARQAAMRQGQL